MGNQWVKGMFGAVKGLLLVGVGAGALLVAMNLDLLAPFGIASESRDSQVIRAMERTQEVSLVSLGIQGIKETKESASLMGQSIPGTGKAAFMQYEFTAKLGLDGGAVRLERLDEKSYLIRVPEFGFIGYDEPTFELVVEDGGILSFVTADIDEVDMINEILSDDARDTYLENYEQDLKDQTQVFYGTLIAGIDPEIEVSYEFSG